MLFFQGKKFVGTENVIPAGYSSVPDTLASQFKACGGTVVLSKKVTSIATAPSSSSPSGHMITVTISDMTTYTAGVVVVSIPLGVLKGGGVTFTPALGADKVAAIGRLGVGLLDKITLLYSEDFWTTTDNGGTTWMRVIDPTKLPTTPIKGGQPMVRSR